MRMRAPFQPVYEDAAFAEALLAKLRVLAPLVERADIDALCMQLAEVQQGQGFVLQAGPCAELFGDRSGEVTRATVALLADLAHVLQPHVKGPVLRLLRGAGQYAKPRNSSVEERAGVVLPSYAGDLVNDRAFDPGARKPNPARLAWAYDEARRALAHVRPETGVYSSHEALHLAWEEAQLRTYEGRSYLQSAHSVWVGDKSRDPSGAHVALAAGIANPVGVKVGPAARGADVAALVRELNPGDVPGRLTLILRQGVAHMHALPDLVEAVQGTGLRVLWMCDPMHGNGRLTADGRKTRDLERMVEECTYVAGALSAAGERLAGLHLELAHEAVQECVGAGVTEEALSGELACDPRLSPAQAAVLVNELSSQF